VTVAVVTGANQGLGYALVEGLCRALPEGVVYLTARDEARGAEAVASLRALGLAPRFARLDVDEVASIQQVAAMLEREHGGVDLVIANAARRIDKDTPSAQQVRGFVTTNNLGTTRLIEQLGPQLRGDGRFLVVASSFGCLRHLPEPLHARFDRAETLADLDRVMLAYADAVEQGTAAAAGWPAWINIASKIGQVAAMRVFARARRDVTIDAVCPGLVDTAASRPWFADMSAAQTPAAAAVDVIWLATAARAGLPHGELVRHREIVAWRPQSVRE
jgi:carbonyl reductase 1